MPHLWWVDESHFINFRVPPSVLVSIKTHLILCLLDAKNAWSWYLSDCLNLAWSCRNCSFLLPADQPPLEAFHIMRWPKRCRAAPRFLAVNRECSDDLARRQVQARGLVYHIQTYSALHLDFTCYPHALSIAEEGGSHWIHSALEVTNNWRDSHR